ncbi:hypothetical protein [Undibacterium umbellatum]|uniref:hypothetical protein n=1 Tax=Undibacterium umbellatum TaxID=2762300 RepID=UPI00164CC990|nr:hypothetical protein [Undibacterium umbellatum]
MLIIHRHIVFEERLPYTARSVTVFLMHAITLPLLNTNLCAINAASAVVRAIAMPAASICDISIIRIIPGR